ncbi:hypothetical protein [Rhodopseudomonas palustris]|uniref:hypothetical protein n=1 Tax=Rhodopseudomonas palustris TaxID=1076 RepID=UPI0021F36A8A|nr:hypothetical protein [Rhodopseudomonas palustris]UYO52513.1 hypothetical protein KQX61_18220 [Rhodopseudomonas palustris]
MQHKSLTVLIDGDILAYKAACINQKDFDLGDDVTGVDTDPDKARSDVEDMIDGVADRLGASEIIVALTGPLGEVSGANFRKELYPDYKGKRGKKPVLLAHVKEHIRSTYSTKIKEGIEADDTLGILATHPTLIAGKKVVVSIDKDLLQIPGRHFNPDTGEKRMISEALGDWYFLMQTLTGDQTDNYPGCPRVGPVKAKAILEQRPDGPIDPEITHTEWRWSLIVEAYAKRGLTEDDALVQARLARILRHTDYDFKRKEPILWTPSR